MGRRVTGATVPPSFLPIHDRSMTCTRPLSAGNRPCYSRRCSCSDCVNKEAWKEYTIHVRSARSLPPDWFLSIHLPVTFYGGKGTTKIINRFFRLLQRKLPKQGRRFTPLWKSWRIEAGTKTLLPHVHALVRCSATLTKDMVHSAWLSLWPSEDDFFCCSDEKIVHVEKIHDVDGAIGYFTKHNQHPQRIKITGRTIGADKRYFAAPKRKLFTDPHYRSEHDTAKYHEEMNRYYDILDKVHPHLMGHGKACDTSLYLAASPRFEDSSLLCTSTLFRHLRDTHTAAILIPASPPSSNSNNHLPLHHSRSKHGAIQNKELLSRRGHRRKLLRYTVWPEGP